MDTTTSLLRQLRLGNGERAAISLEDERTWTYRELASHTYRVANALVATGVGRGDRVGILLRNSLEYWAVYLAIVRLGAIAVRLNWRLAAPELAYALNDSSPRLVFAHGDLHAGYTEPLARAQHVVVVEPETGSTLPRNSSEYVNWLEPHGDHEPTAEPPGFADPCMIMYTSGTTGRPKGALWTQGNTLWFSAMQSTHWVFDASTVHFSTGPMFHVGGFEDWCLPTLMGGGHLVFLRSGAFSIERVSRIARHHGVRTLGLFPVMIHELLNWNGASADVLGAVERVYTGGSSIVPQLLQEFSARFPHIEILPAYGLTEGGALATVMDRVGFQRHPQSVGRPLPFTEVRIARLGDEEVDVAPNEDGHIWVRSPSVCCNYYGKPEATRETFVRGWCRTGDVGRFSPDNYLYITGRVKDMIISGGENIYPVEIENVLSQHPAVQDVAVIGTSDAKWGETPCAVIVQRQGMSVRTEDVIAFARQHLARYKVPRRIELVDELPRNASGKVMKRVLRERFDGPAPDPGST